MNTVRYVLGTSLLLGMLLSVVGCGEDEGDGQDLGCRLNSDCPVDQICQDGVCAPGDVCQGDDCPCAADSDCGATEYCDIDTGSCEPLECLRDRDCELGEVCRQGQCLTDVDADRDRDGVPDTEDSCPDLQNADQEDADGDGQGDLCDDDDDNDAVVDTVDNCPLVANPQQFDADGDRIGNACDDDYQGITIRGQLTTDDFVSPDFTQAEVRISGVEGFENPDESGAFVFAGALQTGGTVGVEVFWPGFITVTRVVSIPDNVSEHTLAPIEMDSALDQQEAAPVRGAVLLQNRQEHSGTLVTVEIAGEPLNSTVTASTGQFALSSVPIDQTLVLARPGFRTERIELVYNRSESRFETGGQPLVGQELTLQAELSAALALTVDVQPDWLPQGERFVDVRVDGPGFSAARRVQHNQGQDPETFEGLPSGLFTIQASRPGFETDPIVVEIEADTTGQATLEVAMTNLAEASVDLSGATVGLGDLMQDSDTIDFVGANFSGVTLAGQNVDVGGLDLSGTNFSNADLSGLDLTGIILARSNLFGADLNQSTLASADLTQANFSSANLRQSNFVGQGQPQDNPVTLTGTIFAQTDMTQADVRGVDFSGLDLAGALLIGTDFTGANLQRANLTLTDLSEAIFDGADMSDATMINAVLARTQANGTNFDGAVLISTIFEDAVLSEGQEATTLRGANLNGASIIGSALDGVILDDATMIGVIVGRANDAQNTSLRGASLRRAYMVGALVADAELDAATFESAELQNATFINCSYDGAIFDSADLTGAALRGEDLTNTRWANANLTQANFSNAVMNNTIIDGIQARQADMSRVVMHEGSARAAELNESNWTRLRGSFIDFTGANLFEANMTGVQIENITFDDVGAQNANFDGARIRDSEGVFADFTDASLRNADLENVTFIPEASFEGAIIDGASVRNSDLTGASFVGASLVETNFTDCAMREISLISANARGAGFSGFEMDLSGSTLYFTDYTNATFSQVNLSGTVMGPGFYSGAILLGVQTPDGPIDFNGAELIGADLTGADLPGSNFEGANFTDAILHSANFTRCDFTEANFTRASALDTAFSAATFNDTIFTETILFGTLFDGTGLINWDVPGTVGFNQGPLEPDYLDGQTVCHDGRTLTINGGCSQEPTLIDGDQQVVLQGEDSGRRWTRPDDDCEADEDLAPRAFAFGTVSLLNNQDEAISFSQLVVDWGNDQDGYLFVYDAPFDPNNPIYTTNARFPHPDARGCRLGNDDFEGTERSRLEDVVIEPGEVIIVVGTTFGESDAMEPFTVTLTP